MDGGPAFPVSRAHFAQDGAMLSADWVSGMTLRDYFAALAVQAYIARNEVQRPDVLAEAAYKVADAMLFERVKQE